MRNFFACCVAKLRLLWRWLVIKNTSEYYGHLHLLDLAGSDVMIEVRLSCWIPRNPTPTTAIPLKLYRFPHGKHPKLILLSPHGSVFEPYSRDVVAVIYAYYYLYQSIFFDEYSLADGDNTPVQYEIAADMDTAIDTVVAAQTQPEHIRDALGWLYYHQLWWDRNYSSVDHTTEINARWHPRLKWAEHRLCASRSVVAAAEQNNQLWGILLMREHKLHQDPDPLDIAGTN